MKFTILTNGDLEIAMDYPAQEKAELQELLDKATHTDHGFLADLLENTGWEANGHMYQVQPEWIGALTDAPILSDQVNSPDGLEFPEVAGRVWWFPNYQVESFAETLIRDGRVVFARAPD